LDQFSVLAVLLDGPAPSIVDASTFGAACEALMPMSAFVVVGSDAAAAARRYEPAVLAGDTGLLYANRFPVLFLNKLDVALLSVADGVRRREVPVANGLLVFA
jgi:hypothetical protein